MSAVEREREKETNQGKSAPQEGEEAAAAATALIPMADLHEENVDRSFDINTLYTVCFYQPINPYRVSK